MAIIRVDRRIERLPNATLRNVGVSGPMDCEVNQVCCDSDADSGATRGPAIHLSRGIQKLARGEAMGPVECFADPRTCSTSEADTSCIVTDDCPGGISRDLLVSLGAGTGGCGCSALADIPLTYDDATGHWLSAAISYCGEVNIVLHVRENAGVLEFGFDCGLAAIGYATITVADCSPFSATASYDASGLFSCFCGVGTIPVTVTATEECTTQFQVMKTLKRLAKGEAVSATLGGDDPQTCECPIEDPVAFDCCLEIEVPSTLYAVFDAPGCPILDGLVVPLSGLTSSCLGGNATGGWIALITDLGIVGGFECSGNTFGDNYTLSIDFCCNSISTIDIPYDDDCGIGYWHYILTVAVRRNGATDPSGFPTRCLCYGVSVGYPGDPTPRCLPCDEPILVEHSWDASTQGGTCICGVGPAPPDCQTEMPCTGTVTVTIIQ